MKNITVPFMAPAEMTQLRKESANSKTGQLKLAKLKHKRNRIAGGRNRTGYRRAVGEYV